MSVLFADKARGWVGGGSKEENGWETMDEGEARSVWEDVERPRLLFGIGTLRVLTTATGETREEERFLPPLLPLVAFSNVPRKRGEVLRETGFLARLGEVERDRGCLTFVSGATRRGESMSFCCLHKRALSKRGSVRKVCSCPFSHMLRVADRSLHFWQ